MSADQATVEVLADLLGIPGSYVDAFGETVPVEIERRRAMLGHLGFPAETADEAKDSLARVRAIKEGLVPRLLPLVAGRPPEIPLRNPGADHASWRILAEDGTVRDGRSAVRAEGGRASLRLPDLPAGYYTLEVSAGPTQATATAIVAPPRCWQPRWMREGGRAWGLAAQVYSFRSRTNLGVGSYRDVADAAAGAGPLGASFLGLSPLHALFSADRSKVSPYSPSSRLFLETIHIDPAAIDGFAGSGAARLLGEPGRTARIQALREASLVDHGAVWGELAPVLEALWTERSGIADPAFERFRQEGGRPLAAHATFEALHARFRHEGRSWLGDWPPEFRDPDGTAAEAYRAEHGDEVGFHAWLQYVADAQLGAAAEAARTSGMSLGLYRDLAVGSDRGGSDVWSNPGRFGLSLSIGAPPDLLAPQGQDWGLPPLHPVALEQEGLGAFRDLVRQNMRHAGAIRIDHAFQLQRLYLIPVGEGGAAGAYVHYPFDAMLAVLRLESHRARALVIAEDLGTGPEGFSDAIMRAGLLSYRVLSFERGVGSSFKPPAAYPADALSVITTHDLPTFVGWWRGLDTDLRQTAGVYDPERAERERAERVTERARLAEALFAERLLPSAEPPEAAPIIPVIRYLARTPSALNAIQYEDVLGSIGQPNMPGTTDAHPNWRRKLEADLETIDAPNGPLAKVAAALGEEGRGTRPGALAAPPPRATYRLQFHRGFTFDDAVAIVPYLARLGISHVYSSPIAKATPGSTHGYDIVDHATINPELGGEEAFLRLSDALRAHGLGLILDIVPNHLGIGGPDNRWWQSTLEWGQLSPHARAFDIDWERLGAGGKLVAPVLGDRYGVALEKGDLKLRFDPEAGSFTVAYFDTPLPITPLAYPLVLDRALAALDELGGHAELIAVSERLRAMAEEPSPERRAAFPEEAEALKARLAAAVAGSPPLGAAIDRAVAVVNGVPGIPESFGTLHRMLEMQPYRPAHWRVAASDINYRRFFDINTLAGIRVELPEIFEAAHALPFRLIREGRVQGLRIDHIDGLADPAGYVEALQRAVGPGFFVVVEKILEPGEDLRPWPVAGTTGYDVLNLLDGVFVDTDNAATFDAIYREAGGPAEPYGDQLLAAKAETLERSFASELEVLVSDLKRIADGDRRTRDFTVYGMRIALTEIIASFPTYRSYLGDDEPTREDVELVESTIAAAKARSRLPDRSLHDFVAACLLGRIETDAPGRPAPDHVARFRRRFQQLTGPVMAKSLEDTLFYRYVRLLPLNEVGGDPGRFGGTIEAFHRANAERARTWPHAMIATATHDTKRGEDARARLLALSELPDRWREAVGRWCAPPPPRSAWSPSPAGGGGSNAARDGGFVPCKAGEGDHAERGGGGQPDPNDRYMLLQAILGAWPNELLEQDDPAGLQAFRDRMAGFAEKALREAKRHSSWVNVDEGYEGATRDLLAEWLAPGSAFLTDLRPLARDLARAGAVTGLARTVLKCTLPGIPDIYQGTEFWDFSLVDPDNRRPVDYAARAGALAADMADPAALMDGWPDGRVKQHVVAALLADRAASPALYGDGDYRAVEAEGERAAHVLAFGRRLGDDALVAAVPRLVTGAATEGDPWAGTGLPLPSGRWRDVLTGRTFDAQDSVPAGELFAALPVAVLRRIA